jgi:hypothetical protein
VYCVGECLYAELEKPGDEDNVELFFHIDKPERGKSEKQYRVTWNSTQLTGRNLASDGVVFKQADPSAKKYIVEIKIPWNTLGYMAPTPNAVIDFDVAVNDNDGVKEGTRNWHAQEPKKSHLYGALTLAQNNAQLTGSTVSAFTTVEPAIDGMIDSIWKPVPAYTLSDTLGKISSDNDLSATFRTMWDKENIYLLVEVTDDVKRQPSLLYLEGDYGLIEQADSKDTVWQMKSILSRYAGGASKNRYVDTVLSLKAGKYVARYISDEAHSYNDWNDTPPEISLYGILIFDKGKQ